MEIAKKVEKHATHAITSFELCKNTVYNLKHFELTPVAKLVLILLTTHFNEQKNGAVVFPSTPFISETLGIGLTATKQALKDLINEGLIIKSKRDKVRGNYNKYLLTLKVRKTTSEQSENECFKQSKSDRFMITNKIEQKKEQTKEKVVSLKKAPSLVQAPKVNERKTVKLDDIPDIIKNNPKVDNKCAYWASLDDEAKQSYIERQKEEEKKAALKAENAKKAEEERKQKEEEERQYQAECQKPLTEQYSYEEACNLIKTFANVSPKMAHTGIAKRLAEAFKIDIEKLL